MFVEFRIKLFKKTFAEFKNNPQTSHWLHHFLRSDTFNVGIVKPTVLKPMRVSTEEYRIV